MVYVTWKRCVTGVLDLNSWNAIFRAAMKAVEKPEKDRGLRRARQKVDCSSRKRRKLIVRSSVVLTYTSKVTCIFAGRLGGVRKCAYNGNGLFCGKLLINL